MIVDVDVIGHIIREFADMLDNIWSAFMLLSSLANPFFEDGGVVARISVVKFDGGK